MTPDAPDTPETSDAPDTADPTASDTATQTGSEPTDDTTPTIDGNRSTGTDTTHRDHPEQADADDGTTHSPDDTPSDGVDTNTNTATDDNTAATTEDTAARRWTLELPADAPADTDERHPSESDEGTATPNTTADTTRSPTATATSEHPTGTSETDTPPLLVAYRHDVHKLRGRAHDAAAAEVAGVPVNEAVPRGADRDAALLSRPRGEPTQTVANHQSPYRLSLLTGEPAAEAALLADGLDDDGVEEAIRDLVSIRRSGEAHRAWLDATLPAMMNESVYYPYTSVKYHTLLTAALLSNYRAGAAFADLYLVVDDPDDSVTPHRTVCSAGGVSLRVTAEPGDRPAAPLGAAPARSWADVWARLPAHPDVLDERRGMILDAQLRRVRSWSVALQFIEDYTRTVTHLSGIGGLR